MSAQNGENDLQSDLEAEVNGIHELTERLEAEARNTERETIARAKQQDIARDMAGLYDVLGAAAVLLAEAKECLSMAPPKGTLRTQLRSVVESATEVIETVTECIQQTLVAGHTEPTDPKPGK